MAKFVAPKVGMAMKAARDLSVKAKPYTGCHLDLFVPSVDAYDPDTKPLPVDVAKDTACTVDRIDPSTPDHYKKTQRGCWRVTFKNGASGMIFARDLIPA